MSEYKPQWGWLDEFESSDNVNYLNFNKSWFQQREALEALPNEVDGVGYNERQGIMKRIVENEHESENCRPEAEVIESILKGADIEDLRRGISKDPELDRLVAIVDDRSSGEDRTRDHNGCPQTAHGLYRCLGKERFRNGNPSGGVATESADCTAPNIKVVQQDPAIAARPPRPESESQGNDGQPDADRRSIFINNLNRWPICALLGTISLHELPVLRKGIYNHLANNTVIEIKSSSDGISTYQLAFHLPYYASRNSNEPVLDIRQDKGGQPLRNVIDVSFLAPEGRRSAFIYAAHISCIITGCDLDKWVAYMFADNFFEADTAKDSVQFIENMRQNEEYALEIVYDPFTRGLKNGDVPISDPRGVFARAFRIRLSQIKLEWTQIVKMLQQSLKEYDSVITRMEKCIFPGRARKPAEDAAFEWVDRFPDLLGRLSESLNTLIEVTETFLSSFLVNARTKSVVCHADHLQASDIATTFEELRQTNNQLRVMEKRFKGLKEVLQQKIKRGESAEATRQGESAHVNKSLTIIMTILAPIVIACSMFSISNFEDVIPVLRPNFKSFGLAIFCIYLLLGALHICLQSGAVYCKKARKKLPRVFEKIRHVSVIPIRFLRKGYAGQRTAQRATQDRPRIEV